MYSTILKLLMYLCCMFVLYAQGAAKMEVETSSSGLVGADDLLIVGPGVLGRLIAQKWQQALLYLLFIFLNCIVVVDLNLHFRFCLHRFNLTVQATCWNVETRSFCVLAFRTKCRNL